MFETSVLEDFNIMDYLLKPCILLTKKGNSIFIRTNRKKEVFNSSQQSFKSLTNTALCYLPAAPLPTFPIILLLVSEKQPLQEKEILFSPELFPSVSVL